ncbi:MAG: tetratricopeptide repeat protein, partial [Rhodothermales bacterium]|nr:tetratricopeptide repeat protein [Rhodothermales bacterium]
ERAADLAAASGAGPEAEAAARYNAGNAAARQQAFEAALDHYRRALLLRPDFEDARYNWELVRRQLQDNPSQSPPENVTPSPFAERLKARADSLVAARAYRAALDLLDAGLQQDSTVAAYRDFIGRLDAVVTIEERPAADAPPTE